MIALLSVVLFLYQCQEKGSRGNGHDIKLPEITENLDIEQVAESITQGVGLVSDSYIGNSDEKVFVFEEMHLSISGQIEIAIMLNRLYRDFNVAAIGLEGEFFPVKRLNAGWFYRLGGNSSPLLLREVAVTNLQEGEINSSEFLAMAHPEVLVFGIEDGNEYKVDLSESSNQAPMIYLFGIAAKSSNQSHQRRFNQLLEKNKVNEAISFFLDLNPFTKEKYKKMTTENVLSAEEFLALCMEIKEKAESENIELGAEAKRGMKEAIEFFKMASQRSNTMVANTITHPAKYCSMIIGAAHTKKVVEHLKEAGHSFVVISPLSLKKSARDGELTYASFKKKMNRLTVDTLVLGQILDNKKPQTVLNEYWFQTKTELYLATLLMVDAVRKGVPPPYNSVQEQLKNFERIKIDFKKVDVIEGGVLIPVNVKKNNAQWEPIWINAADIGAINNMDHEMDLEDRLFMALKNVQKQNESQNNVIIFGEQEEFDIDKMDQVIELKSLSNSVLAAISKSENAIRTFSWI
jgi:hypothetical protein